MKYDFSTIINRDNTSAIKLDRRSELFGNAEAIPMWVADMDFATPPFIIDRLKKRLEHPILGYTYADEKYETTIVSWMANRHKWNIKSEWISFAPGIIAGLNHAIQAFTKQDDKILIQPPVYHPFFHATENNSRQLVLNPLVFEAGEYKVDLEHFEEVVKSGVKLFILCNPHNPGGKVWLKEELLGIAEICLKYDVTIISDEIHGDLVFEPHRHIPLASLSPEIADITITFGSSSKTFNIAGLTSAFAIISNPQLLEAYNFQVEQNGTGHGNILGFEAVKAAFSSDGEEWLNQLLDYVKENIRFVTDFFSTHLPEITVMQPEGTYLIWINFNGLNLDHEMLKQKLFIEAGVALNDGQMFGEEGTGFFRMNLATPRSNVEEALKRIKKVFSVS